MIRVKLLSLPDGIEKLMSFAALGCYQGEEPQMGKVIDLKKRIFDVGHHTVLQHINAIFWVDGLAVSDFTFGLHLCHPFYNTSQRSGRFCATMFSNPDLGKIESYVKRYWPHVSRDNFSEISDFLREGLKIYNNNIVKATESAIDFIKIERPHANAKYIEANASKFAQEQLRVFVPTIFPTAATITMNLSTLVALSQTAWSPTLRDITRKMIDSILVKCPNIAYMFGQEKRSEDCSPWDWAPCMSLNKDFSVVEKPEARLVDLKYDNLSQVFPEDWMTHPGDLSNFHPIFMNNHNIRIEAEVEMSVATMGQDQRHRTIERTEPVLTGKFYLPPLAKACGLEHEAKEFIMHYDEIRKLLVQNECKTLATAIVPYGAMVKYKKIFNLNASLHEMLKRGCWCAQEEIYHLAISLRNEIERKYRGFQASDLLKIFLPICLRTGKCGEGPRYCGRKINIEPYFPERKI